MIRPVEYRSLLAAVLAWILVVALPANGAELDTATLLAQNQSARAAAGLAGVRSIRVEATLLQPELTARLVLQARRPGTARIDVWIADERVFSEAGDGRSGWFSVRSGVPQVSCAEGIARLRMVATRFLYPLGEMDNAGYAMARKEATRIDGRVYHTIELSRPGSPSRLLYLDPRSRFVTRERAIESLQPDLNPQKRWIEILHSDFRLVDGVAYSFQRDYVDLTTLDWLQTLIIDEVILDPALPADAFHWQGPPGPNS